MEEKDYLAALSKAIADGVGSPSTHQGSVEVIEEFEGKIVWKGFVEVFTIYNHPEATTCYAWGVPSEDGTELETTLVLGVPPTDSPVNAVRAAIAKTKGQGDP